MPYSRSQSLSRWKRRYSLPMPADISMYSYRWAHVRQIEKISGIQLLPHSTILRVIGSTVLTRTGLNLFLSVVCRLKRSCTLLSRLKFSAIFLRHLLLWPSVDHQEKFYGDPPRKTPPSGGLNARGVAKYSDYGHVKGYISETVQYMM